MDTTDRTVGGRYRLLEPLGSGGMGTVWRAQDLVLDRQVAVKEVAPPQGVSDDERDVLRERTRREARTAAQLDHPSAVTVYDVVEEDDRPYLVMELVDARTLSDIVRHDGPLSPQRTAEVGLSVLGALEAAHAVGIVHRDVKPGNVLVRDDGRVVLTDFGIATSTGDSSLTRTGLLLGSPSYIAPERARGQAPGPPSDLWSLGATLFTAVEGRPPFDGGEPLLTVTAVVTGEHAPFVAAGPLRDVLEGLLEKDPALRLGVAAARAALEAVARSTATTPLPSVPAPVAQRRAGGTQALPLDEVAEAAGAAGTGQADGPALGRPALDLLPGARRSRGRAVAAVGTAAAIAAVVGAAALLGARGGTGASGDGGAPPSAATTALPAGWRSVSGPAGSTVAVPRSYAAGPYGDATQYKDQRTGRTLRLGTVADGRADAVADRRAQARSFAATHDAYRELRIERVDYRGLEAADWEFTYTDGADLHALSRVFVTEDGRGWSLFFQTRASDDWQAALQDFARIAASFRPG